jgi:hypothetical protein
VFLFLSLTLQEELKIDCFIRTFRYFFYISIVFFVSSKADLFVLKQLIIAISGFSTFFIFIQFFLYQSFGYILHGFFTFLPLYVEKYASDDYTTFYENIFFRPTSFFLEPAHYSRYVLIALALLLFKKEKISSKDFYLAVFISAGIVLSTSSQGYAILLLLWFFFCWMRKKNIESSSIRGSITIILLFLPILLYQIKNIHFVNNTVARTFSEGSASDSGAFGARMNGVLQFFDLPVVYQMIGMGFGSVPSKWVSSLGYWLYGSGFITFIVYVFFMIKNIIHLTHCNKWIFMMYCALFISDDSFYNYMLIPFLTLSCYTSHIDNPYVKL